MCRGGTKHACTSCERLFQDSWDLKEHKKEVHGEVVEEEAVEKGERRRSTRLGRFTGDMQDGEEEKEDDDDITLEEIVAL